MDICKSYRKNKASQMSAQFLLSPRDADTSQDAQTYGQASYLGRALSTPLPLENNINCRVCGSVF